MAASWGRFLTRMTFSSSKYLSLMLKECMELAP
jgi:hypothetical protein